MMLDVPRPLPLGMAARVVSSIPPPKLFSISRSVLVPRGQAARFERKSATRPGRLWPGRTGSWAFDNREALPASRMVIPAPWSMEQILMSGSPVTRA